MYTKGSFNWSPLKSSHKLPGVLFRRDKVIVAMGLLAIVALALSPYLWAERPAGYDIGSLAWKVAAVMTMFVIIFFIVREERNIAGDKWFTQGIDTMTDLPAAMAIIDNEGQVVFANNHLNKTLLQGEERILGKSLLNNLQNERQDDLLRWLKNPASKFIGKLKIGGVNHSFRVTIYPQPYLFQNKRHYVANIEPSRELELSLKKHKEFISTYETVIKSTRNIIWNYNFETNESNYNDTIFTLFGYTPEEVRKNPNWWADNIHPEDKDRVLGRMQQFLAGNILTWNAEYRFRRANGEYRMVEDNGYIKRDEIGKPHLLLGFMTDVTEQKHLQKQLQDEQARHQRELGRAISNAQEAERKSIGDELHDNVCQILGGVKLMVEHCVNHNSENKTELLRTVTVHLADAIVELRKMAHSLSPYFVEKFGLVNGIRELTSFITNYGKTNVRLDVVQFDEGLLSNSKKLLLYRIMQEQLNNIVKHARATDICIKLQATGNSCCFSVQDNGVGMELDEMKKGFGLKNIQNRAQLLNGQVQFISSPGNGFLLEIRFDIE